jgi:hypothetical protein
VKIRTSDRGFVVRHLKHDTFTDTGIETGNVKFNVPRTSVCSKRKNRRCKETFAYPSTKFTSVGINTPDDILTQIGASAQIPKIQKVQY